MKKIFKNKKFYIISAIVLTIVGIAAGFISGLFKANDSLNYKAYVGSYETNKNPITEFTYVETPADVEMKNFYDYNADSNKFTPNDPSTVLGADLSNYKIHTDGANTDGAKYIGISTMTELVAFSMLCSPDKDPNYYASYLDFNYVLTDNIKSDSALQFIPIGVDSEVTINNTTYNKRAFSGIFNGNGYDITGLQFITITDINGDSFELNYPIKKSAINYFAMFSLNEGTIGNFGLINPNISFNYTAVGNKFDKVAMICGENKGTIEKVYVRDLRSASNNKSGIMAFGGYIISGLVYSNAQGGKLKNSYVAYNSVVNGSVYDSHDFNEILYTNTSTATDAVKNLYVYNQSVQSIEGEATNATTYPVGNGGVAIGTEKKITYTNGQIKKRKLFGTYCYTYQKQSQDEKEVETKYLNEYINSKDNTTWYTATIADFNTVDAAYNMSTLMPTPILRGITYNTTNENDKYFVIKKERDYAFMYEMFNASSYFASSDFTYQIEADINLSGLAAKRYKYSGGIGATIRGKVASYSSATIGVSASTVPTIYHPDYENTFTTVEGFNAYGLFPYIKKGTIKDLNVITVNSKSGNTIGTEEIDVTSTNGNVAAFGTVCGYLDSGKIENVNVYEKIKLTGKAKAFIGGAVGVLTGQAVATDVTNNGDITVNITDVTEDPIDYMKGISIGGVVGYIHNSTADIKNSLNTANITVTGITTVDYTVGGILGAGYTNKIENVENIGKLTFDNKYNTLFIAGIIGRHLGMKEQSDGLTNYGDIEITDNGNLTYICGVLNATPITSTENGLNKADAYLLNSNYKAIGQYYYNATMLTNGSNITINNTSHTYRANTHFTDVINVVTSECIVKLSAVYNLAYKQDYAGTKSNIDTDNNNVQIIDMNTYHTFSPVLNYEYKSSKYDALEISTAYNLRNIKYTMSSAITGNIDLNYTNVINGDNVTLINVRNEGNMTFDITETFTAKLYASGIIKSISANAKADAVVNGGDIKLNHSSMINGDLYIAGICYENHNTTLNTSIDKYNPNKGTFDAKAIGAINNAINAGAIEVTNTAYASSITYTATPISSSNGQQDIGYYHNPTYSGNYIKGNLNVAGITNVNYSIITNTFNIGDIFTANVCKTNGYTMNSAGIVDLNIGQYAYILNSANNGDIKSINMYNSSITTSLTTAGIVARNDLNSNLETYSSNNQNPHSKQVIAFTINYGAIYAYNYNENIVGTNAAPNSISSGIVGMGILNVVNVLNYGNIFSSETVSGIFGVVYFERFETEVSSSNKVMLANTINYGNTFILYKGYNKHENEFTAISKGHYDHNIIEYSMFKSMDLNYSTFTYNNSSKNRNSYANYLVSREVSYKSINGSIFSIINFDDNDNAQYVTIRYLINFEENAPLVGYEPATPIAVSINRSTIYSAYSKIDTRNNGSGQMVRDTYMSFGTTGNYVIYSPLNSDTKKKIKTVTSDSTVDVLNTSDVSIETITYNGVFSKEFDFYKAIIKTYSQDELDANPTDAFLGDFFQFVEYSYINDVLVEKIGWKDIAYMAAANEFAKSTSSIDKLLEKFSVDSVSYTTYTNAALDVNKTSIWTKWSSNSILTEVIDKLINNNEIENLELMLEYIFSSDSKSNVLITTEIRKELFERVITSSLTNSELMNILTSILTYQNGYSQALADAILEGDSDVYDFVNDYLTQLCENSSNTSIVINLLKDYITILGDRTTEYFSYKNNEQVRYDILNAMFDGINDDYFYEILCNLLDITSLNTYEDKVKMYQGYDKLSNDEKYQLYLKIIENNSNNNINTYLSKMDGEIGYYARLVETGYISSSLTDTYNSIGSGTTTAVDETTIDERVNLWNKIRNSETFRTYLKNERMTNTYYYFLATEHNNTYQSTTAPNNDGAYSGDLSYFYTRSISPSTYFYGPYKSADPDGKNGVEFNTKTIYYNTYVTYDAMTTKQYHSFFIGDSLSFVDEYVYYNFNTNKYEYFTNQTSGFENEIGTDRIDGVLPASLYMYEFGYTGANNQFSFVPILKSTYYTSASRTTFDGQSGGGLITDFGGTTLKTTSAYMINGGNRIELSNATISYHVVNSRDNGRFQIIDAKGNPYTIQGEFTVYDDNIKDGSSAANNLTYLNVDYYEIDTTSHYIKYKNSGDRTWGDFIYRYGRNYYFSEVDYNYHRTRKTGIYEGTGNAKSTYTASGYANNNANVIWLTHKQSDKRPVITSQYMDYTVDQLLELDGYYTKFDDGTTKCDDERNIINAIFRYYLCNDESKFKTIISKSLMEVLVYDVESSLVYASWGYNYPYYITSATRGNVSIIDEGNDSYNNINTTTNWYNNKTSISGTITSQNAYYYNNGWRQKNINYTVNVTGIKFNKDHSINTSTISVTSDTVNNISNTSLSYSNGVLTLSFRHNYIQNDNNYYYNITVPINITTYQVINVSDGYKIENSGSYYYIKKDDNIVATITNNSGTVSYSLNTSEYEYKNITFNQSSDVFISFICSPKNKINYSFIDSFVNANIYSDTIIDSNKLPFAYLMYDNTQSVKNYLISKAPNQVNNYKEWLISNATNTESKYYGLISKLLDLKVLTPSEMSNSKNATIAGANGVTVSNVSNAVINTALVNDSTSTLYGGVTYSSTNSRGFNTTSITLSGFNVANIGIIAKGSSANANMTITTTHSDGTVENLNGQTKKVVSNTSSPTYTGVVDTTKAYLYVISQNALYDMVPMSKFKYDTEYYTYDSSTNTYTSVGILFKSGTTYYRNNNGSPRNVTLVNSSGEGNYDNNTQLYNNNRMRDQDRVNDTSVVYYERTASATPNITLTMSDNVVIYGIYQGTNNLINYNFTSVNDYLSSIFYGSTSNHVSNDDHRNDLIKMLINLLPIQTSYYIESSDVSNLIVDYQSDSITSVDSLLIQYLSANPVSNYTISNLYKLIVCSSNDVFKQLLSKIKTQITSEITSEYTSEQIATIHNRITTIHTSLLKELITNDFGYICIADYIDKYHSLGLNNTNRLITAAYIASDYENQYQQSLASGNNVLLYNSQLRLLLAASNKKFNNVSIQYFNSNGTFNNDKFDALLGYLGLGSSNDVYGIYALASSLGIQNGDFIPDNLNLASMEAYYQADSTYGFILIDAESANWRINGKVVATKYGDRYTGNNSTEKSDSVNYAFLIEMKQLKKSIATTLFELDLEVAVESQLTTTYTMYSSEDLIEEYKLRDGTKKKAILYYVPTEYFNQITSVNKNLNVDEIIISTTAKAYKNDSSTEIVDKKTNSNNFTTYSSGNLVKCNTLTNIDYYNNSDLADGYVIQNAVRVVAEETSVYRYYDIVLLPVDFSFKIEYQQISNVTSYASFGTTSSTVAATDGVVSIKLESPVFTKIIKNDDANTVTFDETSIYYELTYASASVNEDTFKTDGTYSDSVDGYLYTLNNSTYTKVTSGSYSSSTQYYKQVYVITADTERQANKDYYVSFTKATEKTFAANKTYYTLSGSTYSKATVTAGATIPSSTDYYIAGKAFTLPKGFDLSKYVSISLPGSNTAIENAFTFTDIAGNYIVKENGSADITLDISDDLAKGTYDLTINLYGCTQTLVLKKNPNNDVNLTMKYDGINLSFTKEGNEYVAESDILWGTPFTIGDLKSLAYADSYELAPNATMTVTIDEIVDSYTPNNVSYDVWTYKVKILVTAENGEDTKTYVHKLKEMNPFTANEAYATVYKQGIQILKPALNVVAGDSTTDSNYVLNNVTTVSYPRNDGEPDYRIKYDMSKIYYNGSSEALNDERIHDYNEYKLSVVNGNEDYTLITNESEMTALNPVELLYAGMSVQINNDIDTGTYTFAFVYRTYTLNEEYYEITYALANVDADTFTTKGSYSDSIDGYLYTLNEDTYTKVTSGDYSSSTQYYKQVYTYTSDIAPETGKTYYTLSDSVYSVANLTNVTSFTETRELVFPKVKVIKTPAVDAVVESATFINNYEALGSLATLINPAKSIVPSTDAYNKDGGEPLYDSLIAGDGQKMTVDATDRSIKYEITDGNTTYNYETETDDYYIVGTTSNANLKNYAPSVALRSEYAKFFQVLSQRKIANYDGRFNGGTTEDTTNQDFVILNDHKGSYVYLYVLFNTDSVFLVQTHLNDMSYGKIYKTDSKTGIGQKVGDVSSDNLKGRGLYNIEFDYNGTTYKASTLNGDTSTRNSSLYMDYTKATTNNRFWYVSYVVFSEDFFLNGLGDNVPDVSDIATSDIWGHRAKFYNIAVIDISNNIRFTIEVDAPDEFRDILSSLYVTLSYNKYVSSVLTDSKQLSVYAEYQDKLYNSDSAEVTTKVSYVSGGTYYFYDLTTESRQAVGWTGDRMDTYIPEYALQLMPTAYYKFYINLPAGYEATYTVTEGKENTYKKNPNADEAGSYLPPSSLVTQDIKITITIKTKDDYEAISTWGINTSDVIVTEVKPDSSVNPTEES